MPDDRPSDQPPTWHRRPLMRARAAVRRNIAARPWYADRLERRRGRPEPSLPLGPYETRYDVSDGYAFERPEDSH